MDVTMKMIEAYEVAGGIAEQAISSIRTQGFCKGIDDGKHGNAMENRMVYVSWAFQAWAGTYLVTEKGEKGGSIFERLRCTPSTDLEDRKGKLYHIGSGKSRVISLLQRFYEPNEGQLLLDGHKINTIQLKWWKSQMGLVKQEPVLFETSIKENILFGEEGSSMDDVINAAKDANAHDFITKLTDGYETQVGQFGFQLSGGQKQRIAIARAVIRDPTIRTSNLIVVIQARELIESGSHEQLMQINNGRGGEYFQMVQLQQMAPQNKTYNDFIYRNDGKNSLRMSPAPSPVGVRKNTTIAPVLSRLVLTWRLTLVMIAVQPLVIGILDTKSEIDPKEAMPFEQYLQFSIGKFNNVFYAYPTRPHLMIFNGLNLKIDSGKTVALVGPSGSGKSTIIGLMERFSDPLKGTNQHCLLALSAKVLPMANGVPENLRYERPQLLPTHMNSSGNERWVRIPTVEKEEFSYLRVKNKG
uniref:ABC transporter domain-containing protein n=1 Tax=Salix viminalis TaxID=40686 RepID=A0A6N2MPE4_SALVM